MHLWLARLRDDNRRIVYETETDGQLMQQEIQDSILLWRTIHNKDREALGRLHSIYYLRIKHYIASRINSIPDAEDLAQDVFFELCEGNGSYDGQSEVKAYLFGVARNTIGRYYRNKKKQSQTVQIDSVGDIVANGDIQQHQPVSIQELKELLKDATEQLPPKAGEAVRLRLCDGLTPKEAAERIGCSVNVLNQRFYDGAKLLKKKNNLTGP